jgi:hypothetical protein
MAAEMADVLAADGKKTALPSGDAAVAAITRGGASSADIVVDRLVQQVGIALTDVHGSVTRRLDELQTKLDAIRSRLTAENSAARARVETFVRLSTEAVVASHAIDAALEKLDSAIG